MQRHRSATVVIGEPGSGILHQCPDAVWPAVTAVAFRPWPRERLPGRPLPQGRCGRRR
ncbi:hypothetical protein [Streptomyces deccanensis]|uniref:hypothetical protein n=1 Tax=Streptomyces deccanensis TaxID=424188 RepID=UPI001EFBA282|nr:hypothetical protein [Streptomyces deccanensis]ULR52272.1 hypothetical protein L3078_24960 [Streptomyces deccanensis]